MPYDKRCKLFIKPQTHRACPVKCATISVGSSTVPVHMKNTELVPQHLIENKILIVRGRKVMLDRDLAVLYRVTTSNLNKAVKRNLERFPVDFMLQLTNDEFKNLKFHFGTSSWGVLENFLTLSLRTVWLCSQVS